MVVVTGLAVWLVRLLVAAVFATAAWGKAADQGGTRAAVAEFGVPARAVGWAAVALPGVEGVLAAAVLVPRVAVAACGAVVLLLAGFSGVVARQLAAGSRPACSCFGVGSVRPVGGWTLARNAVIGVLAVVAGWGSWIHPAVPLGLPVDRVAGVAAVVAVAAVQLRQGAQLRAARGELAQLRAGLPRPEGLPVGSVAPAFDLPAVEGGRGGLAGLVAAGRPVVLVFLHPECGPCQIIAHDLPQWRAGQRQALTVVPIGTGDLDANRVWARRHGLTGMLVQATPAVGESYRLRGTPTAVLIDTRSRIAAPPARGPRAIEELITSPPPVKRPLLRA